MAGCVADLVSEVDDGTALYVLMAIAEASLVAARVASHAAKSEARARELFPEAHVERHIACIGVHVEPEI